MYLVRFQMSSHHMGVCSGYEANIDKLHDTRPDAEDPDKNKEKKTTADVA